MRLGHRGSVVTCALLLGALARPSAAQQIPGVDSLIARRMSEAHIPGLAAALLDSGRVIWTGTYGKADVAAGTPVTDSTPFQIASVSKPVTATVLMTLYAAGRFRLDDDINRYLPFAVRNPSHPNAPITFRQLLIHRSSIADNMKFYGPFWNKGNGDVLTPLKTYLRDYLTKEGRHYSKSNFLEVAPGDSTLYCNTCYALLGYLAEVISGVPFADLSDSVLFKPLGMTETHWFARDFAADRPATPHRFAADTGYVAYPQNGYPDWPAGTLRTSIRDLARFLSMYMNAGMVDGRRMIPSKVVDAMAPTDLHAGFLTWWPFGVRTGEVLYMHNGGDNGVRTSMAFARRARRGVIVLTNGEAPVEQLSGEMYARMVESRQKAQDRLTAVRRELEERYKENEAGFFARDPDRVMRLRHPDFHTITPDRKVSTREQMYERTRQFIGRIERFDSLTETITQLELAGDTAHAVVDQHTVRQQRLADGALHEVRTSVTQRESWIRTPNGWLFWRVDEIRPGVTFVDGKKTP